MKTYIFAAVILALFGAWIYAVKLDAVQNPKPSDDLVVVIDTSSSASNLGCPAVTAKVQDLLSDPAFHIGKDSKFALIHLQGSANSYEAGLAMDVSIPKLRSGLIGAKTGMKQFASTLQAQCAKLPQANGSAIFRSVEIALDYMKARGCGKTHACALQVISDGLENGSLAVERYLSVDQVKSMPARLDNASVAARTMWCGWSQSTEAGGPLNNPQALVNRWAAMFTGPIATNPYCSAAQSSSRGF